MMNIRNFVYQGSYFFHQSASIFVRRDGQIKLKVCKSKYPDKPPVYLVDVTNNRFVSSVFIRAGGNHYFDYDKVVYRIDFDETNENAEIRAFKASKEENNSYNNIVVFDTNCISEGSP